MKILITGACGFVARVLTTQLEHSNQQHEIVLLDRVEPGEATIFVPGSSERALQPLETSWPYIRAEITDAEAMLAAMRDVDAVVHLAAAVSGLPEFGVQTFHANACGTFIGLDAARKTEVKRFYCASSINAFGTMYWRLSGRVPQYISMPLTEEFPPVPEDPYSLSKYVNEQTCAAFSRAYGLTTAAFRFAAIWTDDMYRNALANGLAPTDTWSDDLFQWVHVEDIAQGILRAIESPSLPVHGVYSLGAADTRCPEPTLELLQRFRPELAANITQPLPERAPLLSIDLARQTFGYDPVHVLSEGAESS